MRKHAIAITAAAVLTGATLGVSAPAAAAPVPTNAASSFGGHWQEGRWCYWSNHGWGAWNFHGAHSARYCYWHREGSGFRLWDDGNWGPWHSEGQPWWWNRAAQR